MRALQHLLAVILSLDSWRSVTGVFGQLLVALMNDNTSLVFRDDLGVTIVLAVYEHLAFDRRACTTSGLGSREALCQVFLVPGALVLEPKPGAQC